MDICIRMGASRKPLIQIPASMLKYQFPQNILHAKCNIFTILFCSEEFFFLETVNMPSDIATMTRKIPSPLWGTKYQK